MEIHQIAPVNFVFSFKISGFTIIAFILNMQFLQLPFVLGNHPLHVMYVGKLSLWTDLVNQNKPPDR